ncbi:hypothetical protein LTR08_000106 [Meristemomyces frigidus]|nr:hypothetical protein LTR08_000106 [Meristemomyces frigidus]
MMSCVQSDGGEQGAIQQTQPKPLRFVTNYGAPHPKRRRIGAACLTCRKRKTACSGERPSCVTCAQNKLECAGYSSETSPGRKLSMSDVNTRQAPEVKVKERQRSEQLKRKVPSAVLQSDDCRAFPRAMPSSSQEQAPAPGTRIGLLAAELDRERERDQEPLFSGPRNRMPYFRWLGPTAIMPGYKQMVVKVKRQDPDMARSSSDSMLSPSLSNGPTLDPRLPPMYSNTPTAVQPDARTPLDLPFYDASPMPPSELITHLANTFFTHLGCNYSFLHRARFLLDLEAKHIDAVLVDAVCALAARFSTHGLLIQQPHDDTKPSPAEYGHAFAQRAKAALMDSFCCPSVAAVQAALLLAYNEFGEGRDSGLWMYLGISIRMAQDLGMHKLEGLMYRGKDGPTPKMVKRESLGGITNPAEKAVRTSERPFDGHGNGSRHASLSEKEKEKEEVLARQADEQERIDTFWAVFFLDRVVSSGTGRRSTLRDKDIELSFPSVDAPNNPEPADPHSSSWPAPFPALIRIVHLYGRVADLLNTIKEPSDITAETPKRLAAMESQVTHFYQHLPIRLHFDAVNFQHYMKAGQGTNFILLHFWFHTLIVLLHQPTLLKTLNFEGQGVGLQLFPNSQQLSMSSAKTIADILSYSQLMDAKASLGNPFTTQPIYIAACAFLRETAEQTATSNAQSRVNSPSRKETTSEESGRTSSAASPQSGGAAAVASASLSGASSVTGKRTPTEHRGAPPQASKHSLLATAASQHYQLCYSALQSLETYWSGTKYILTVLDQKFEGVGDPLLYTVEEGEGLVERPAVFGGPGWRPRGEGGGGGKDKAVGWTLTGTMNSPSTVVAWHIPSSGPGAGAFLPPDCDEVPERAGGRSFLPPRSSLDLGQLQLQQQQHQTYPRPSLPANAPPDFSTALTHAVSNADADLLLGLGGTSAPPSYFDPQLPPVQQLHRPRSTHHDGNDLYGANQMASWQGFGDMMIESQDVSMSVLGLDTMPWFDSWAGEEVFGGYTFDPGGGGGDARAQGGGGRAL